MGRRCAVFSPAVLFGLGVCILFSSCVFADVRGPCFAPGQPAGGDRRVCRSFDVAFTLSAWSTWTFLPRVLVLLLSVFCVCFFLIRLPCTCLRFRNASKCLGVAGCCRCCFRPKLGRLPFTDFFPRFHRKVYGLVLLLCTWDSVVRAIVGAACILQ